MLGSLGKNVIRCRRLRPLQESGLPEVEVEKQNDGNA